MNQIDAEAEASQLNATHPERERWEWKALRRAASDWAVVKGPRRTRIDPVKATTEAAPKPAQPDDPWAGPVGNLPGYR
jgi:hypothetical protein